MTQEAPPEGLSLQSVPYLAARPQLLWALAEQLAGETAVILRLPMRARQLSQLTVVPEMAAPPRLGLAQLVPWLFLGAVAQFVLGQFQMGIQEGSAAHLIGAVVELAQALEVENQGKPTAQVDQVMEPAAVQALLGPADS